MFDNRNEASQLSSESKLLLWIDFGFAFAISLSGLFLSIYLWRLTESWMVNGLYHISLFTFVVVGFIVGGWISKRKERLWTFRLGTFLMVFFFLSVIIFQERVAEFPVLFGAFNGLAQGFYWISMSVIAYDVTNNDNRLRYFGWQSGVMALAGLLGPLLSGYVIEWFPNLIGYIVVFAISLVIFILVIFGSLFLKPEKYSAQTFLLSFIFRRTIKSSVWKKHFFGWFMLGLLEGVILVVPPILLYHIVQKESIVGLLVVIFGLMNIISSQLLARFGKKEYYRSYIFVAAIGVILTSFVLMYEVSFVSVVITLIGNAFFSPVLRISYTSYLYRLMSELPNSGKKLKTELIATRQMFLILGRILPIGWFMMFAVGVDYQLIAWVVVLTSISQLALYFMVTIKHEVSISYDRNLHN